MSRRSFLFKESGWSISNLSLVQYYGSVIAGNEGGIYVKPDGTRLYLTSFSNYVYQLDMSTAWDLSTATITSTTTGINTGNQGISFSPDGLKMYIAASLTDGIYEYNLSTAWDVTTFSYVANKVLPSIVTGLYVKQDGTKIYVTNGTTDTIDEYDLSTAWSVATMSLVNSFSVSAQTTYPRDVFFKPDGYKMYMVESGQIHEYNLSTAWDTTTATHILGSISLGASAGLFIDETGTRVYTAINQSVSIGQWEMC